MSHKKNRKPFSERLRQAIRDSGMSEAELARRCGVSQPQINRFMNGKLSIGIHLVDKILEHVEVRNAD